MPTFYAKGISIQVSVARLAQTSSPGIPASVPLKHIESVFAEDSIAGTLFEHPICHDGEDKEEHQLHFLDDLIPFYMRRVGKHFFDNQVNKERNIRPKRIPSSVKVSLSLNIQLAASLSDWHIGSAFRQRETASKTPCSVSHGLLIACVLPTLPETQIDSTTKEH